ncbi:MAG: hypothetical protein OXI81_17425 [Paracoccaceae bacterium]|nr:hypothetical protein [Paracoccaceae bacterium]MDE2911908.1 hypothetical protein [Paracoccaceae bacterium]
MDSYRTGCCIAYEARRSWRRVESISSKRRLFNWKDGPIAVDLDYDGRNQFPRQVFFPMAGTGDGWATLARDLMADIDTGQIETYGGSVSLPFEAGENGHAAVRIVDDRGMETPKIVELA